MGSVTVASGGDAIETIGPVPRRRPADEPSSLLDYDPINKAAARHIPVSGPLASELAGGGEIRMQKEGPAVDRLQPRRWRVLAALQRIESPATIDEVTDELHESRAPGDPLAGLESWDRTNQRLHDVDLPALDVVGLVEYDETRGVVTVPRAADPDANGSTHAADGPDVSDSPEPTTVTGSRDESLDGAGSRGATGSRSDRNRWRYRYLVATVGSALLLLGTAMLVPAESTVSTAAAATVAGVFAILSITHVRRDR